MKTKFEPCPFCGHPDVAHDEGCFPLNHEETIWEVRCGNPSCFAHDASAPTREEAIAKWNRRAVLGAEPVAYVSEHSLRRVARNTGAIAIFGIEERIATKPSDTQPIALYTRPPVTADLLEAMKNTECSLASLFESGDWGMSDDAIEQGFNVLHDLRAAIADANPQEQTNEQ